MLFLTIPTPVLQPGDDLAAVLRTHAALRDGDIVVLSSKAVATVEGAVIDLASMEPTAEAETWAKKTGSRGAAFIQAVLEETKRLHGRVVGACPGALLTEVKPEGLNHGTILTANAGLDESNVAKGFAVGWPKDPVASVSKLRKSLVHVLVSSASSVSSVSSSLEHPKQPSAPAKRIAIILTDSCCRPRRLGVTAFALAVAGLDPLVSQAGRKDLFGKELRITTEAVADQLATAANFVMGNAGQSVPAVIIRDHGLTLSDFAGWVPGIEPEEDLFRGVI